MQQLSALDNGMLGLESSRTPNHLCMVNIYDVSTAPDGQVTFKADAPGRAVTRHRWAC